VFEIIPRIILDALAAYVCFKTEGKDKNFGLLFRR